jgi:hypothetical protein
MNESSAWIEISQELPEEGQRVFFLTAGRLCGIGCLQYEAGRPVWHSEFAWGEFDADERLDPDDPDMEVRHWTLLAPPPYPGE